MTDDDFFSVLRAQGKLSAQLNYLYNTLDDWLLAGQLMKVDEVLACVDINTTNYAVLIGFLTVTLPWKSRLTTRTAFLEKVRSRVMAEEPHRAEQMLYGLA